MRNSVSSDVAKSFAPEATVPIRIGLYVGKYQPDLFQERRLVVPERKRNALRKRDWNVERIVHEIYSDYVSFFSLKSGRNVASCTTEYYMDALYRYMEAISGELGVYCKVTGQEGIYHTFSRIVLEGKTFLLNGLQDELREKAARYALRPVVHYVRLANHRLAYLRECTDTERNAGYGGNNNNEISVSAVCEALLADCEERVEHFIKKAQHRYEAYVEVVRLWAANHQIGLPDYADGEEWETFCHVLKRKRKLLLLRGGEDCLNSKKKYASYTPCDCGLTTCKTWKTGDEADYEISKWYGAWYGEQGEKFAFTEETIGGWKYNVKRCYMDMLPQGKRLHIEFCYDNDPDEVWMMHIGQNLLELKGQAAELNYVVLENLEHQIMRAYCEENFFLDNAE